MALPFTLTVEEDEIIVNPTFAHKMKNDFGISLPDFPDNSKDADCVTRYFDDVAKEISGLKNWDVDPTVVLSLFSFLNINMFYDLENNRENITAHPIIKALCGDPAEIMNEGTIAPYEYKHDEKNPFDVFQILDADSSQQDAIVSAKKGLSFVLQGPPGTGKSQTIANIISECLADNKKVLFVSEKAAALDVVFKRLTGAGIGNFCLPIHSHKSNKNEILAQIAAAWELSSARNPKDDSLSKLSFVRNQLNQYCEELHKQRSALKKSVFEVYG